MGHQAARVTCPRCGANNFDSVSTCWKCQAPLSAARPPVFQERSLAVAPGAAAMQSGDPSVARRAAVALGVAIPYVGLPVGWVFMMIEDQRKQEVGRICVYWSLISLVVQTVLMFIAAQAMVPFLMSALHALAGGAARGLPSGAGL